ncbi:MAG: hypothetical protein ABII10_01685 [Candidatus Paceibacterota bacterium]
MKKLAQILTVFMIALVFSASVVLAATLAVTSIGGVTVSGTLTSFTTTKTSPTFIGTATNGATIDITIDDLMVAATADATGNWSYTPTSLTIGAHAVEIASNLETISFTLTVGDDATSTSTSSSTTTTESGTSTSTAELPQSGSVENTFLVIAAGMFLIGSGVVAHQILPLPEKE